MDSHELPRDAAAHLAQVRASHLDTPLLEPTDSRWVSLWPATVPAHDLRDRCRGALIGGAIGDAMGRPNEGVPAAAARARRVRAYQPWKGWTAGPTGTITDDTQMTLWLAESLLAGSERAAGSANLRDRLLDPDELARRFTREHIRGIGKATREFVHNYKDLQVPWHEAGVRSAGNGTAMRAAPVGLVHLRDPFRIYRDSLVQAVVTHRDAMAIAAAAVQAYVVARAAAAPAGTLTSLAARQALCADLAVLLAGLEPPGNRLRGGRGATTLHGRLGTELPCYLQEGTSPLPDWHNGAYVLESLPSALWCALQAPEDFEAVLFTAVDAGHDADTVAAMACTVAGASLGYARLPAQLSAELEDRDHILEVADGLYELNRRLYGSQ